MVAGRHGNRRLLRVDLGRIRPEEPAAIESWTDEDPVLAEISGLSVIADWGGNALGLAVLAGVAREAEAPLILTAGAGVAAGLPTAMRASVLSRSPLTGLLAEGQLGGELGPRLATHADALVLEGRAGVSGAVLVLRSDGTLELEPHPELVGADPVVTWRCLMKERADRRPPPATLCVGPGGERELPFASLAGGGERPSFVGRGGLGAVFGRLGLKGLVIEARDGTAPEAPGTLGDVRRDSALVRALVESPRLQARAADGTLELYGAFAARGDLLARNYTEPVDVEHGAELQSEARSSATDRHGCRGCPTPCGWVFERSDGRKQSAHFSSSYALGTNLGLESFDDSLVLLEACDRLGLDAKEVGAVLALACRSGTIAWGDRQALLERLLSLVELDPVHKDDAARHGALAYARELGLEDELAQSRGQSARPESSRASILGQCVTAGGTDPMRSFPFLIEASGRAGLERVCADLGPLPPGAEDPGSPVAKGRLVAWHENLVAAVDMSGFCAFSTAGLLADGLSDVEQLARWILPPRLAQPERAEWSALSPGQRLLAAGANLVLLRREINRRWGAPADQDRPAWAAARLAEPGMLDEYLRWRGLDESGYPLATVRERLGSPDAAPPVPAPVPAPVPVPERSSPPERHNGRVELRVLGSERDLVSVELPLPAPLSEVLALGRPEPAKGAPPAVWRAGRRLEPGDPVKDGDVLDLVTVIAGG